ncbi:hypothetical protein B0A48_12002 [Cryoendolithus antarcticus]|uniref:Uncharacterized protein n=1 Tax=Cryoendolithus antarcticus TaxID=1507870 RepID=A0A1V8STF1_9PEZI|nr:hypothetical protein B0A48_12002 [Cryoendolithus antarcticus]
MPDSSPSSVALAQMTTKLQKIRTAHNHNSAVVTNLRTQLAEAEDLFAKNGDDIQHLVKEIERLKQILDQDATKSKPEPEMPEQVVKTWLYDVEVANQAQQTKKPKSFSPFSTNLQPESGVDEPALISAIPASSTRAPAPQLHGSGSLEPSFHRSPAPHTPKNTLNEEPYTSSSGSRRPPQICAESPNTHPAKRSPFPCTKWASPPPPYLDNAAVIARSTSPSPSPQPFTNFTLTTLPDAIHPSFPTVLSINNCWVSVTCAYCGANSCSQPGGGRGFLKGLVGLTNHVVQAHGPGTANSRFEGDACLAEILEHCRLTEISERDAKLLAGGSQAVDRPVKRVTLDYEIARQKWKMKQGGEGMERQGRQEGRQHFVRDDREESLDEMVVPRKPSPPRSQGIKIRGRGEMHGGEGCGGKRKEVFCKGSVEKKLRWGENTIVKIENDNDVEMGRCVEMESEGEMEYGVEMEREVEMGHGMEMEYGDVYDE